MKNFRILSLAATICGMTATAFAAGEGVGFQASLQSEYLDDFGTITFKFFPGHKVFITRDPRHCSAPGPCALAVPSSLTATMSVLVDKRPVDGALQIQFSVPDSKNPLSYTLLVSTAENSQHKVRYFLNYKIRSTRQGGEISYEERQAELQPVLDPLIDLQTSDNPAGYVCKEYVNCMPRIVNPRADHSEYAKYCSKDYRVWAKKNCEKEPTIVE